HLLATLRGWPELLPCECGITGVLAETPVVCGDVHGGTPPVGMDRRPKPPGRYSPGALDLSSWGHPPTRVSRLLAAFPHTVPTWVINPSDMLPYAPQHLGHAYAAESGACAASGHAAAPPSSVMNSRRLMGTLSLRIAPTTSL